ncbi:MAG: metallophosphoesterase [Bryobacterales bacterium]|nr:metallophosphoesterase [Bryobacterales bacterium]
MLLRRRTFLALSLLLLAGCRQSTTHELTILHFNDFHDRLLPDADGRGGVAHLATLLKRERAAASASLTLHAGDLVQGTPVSTLFEGLPDYEIANSLGIDVNCLGNHEFDYGWWRIRDFMQIANFPTVGANAVDASGNRLVNPPYVIRDAGGMRVAVIGALLEDILNSTTLDRLGPYHAAPTVETLRPIVAEAKQRADMVIVLAHLERTEAESILRALPDVSVVVIGHEHTPAKPLEVDGRFVVHAEGYGREVGRLVLRYDTATRRITSHEWTALPVDDSEYPADPGVQAQVDRWEAKVSAVVDVPIGSSTKKLSRPEVKELMERAMQDRFPSDLAFTNVSGVRDTLPEGQLLARHVWNVMPFDNRVVIAEVPGDQLMTLEDPSRPVKVAGTAKLDPKRTYRLVTTDFMASSWRDRGSKFRVTDQGVLLRDVLIDWIKQKKAIP